MRKTRWLGACGNYHVVLVAILMVSAHFCAHVSARGETATPRRDTDPLSPAEAWDNVCSFAAQTETILYENLRPVLVAALTNDVKGHFSLYFEDLASGARMGISENECYNSWSLLKIPVMVTILKKVGQKVLSFDRKVPLKGRKLESHSGSPIPDVTDDKLSVKVLIERLVRFSDNTASFVLGELFSADEFQQTLLAMGLPQTPPGRPKNDLPLVSARQYANMLRSLYYSAYLTRPFSQLALAIMSETIYDGQIRGGLPADVDLAHMVGFNAGCGEFHDCGIVYLPGKPYVLCVMSTRSTREEANRIIREVSRRVYEYCSSANP